MTEHSNHPAAWQAIALLMLLFCAYNLNFIHGNTTDNIPSTALPASIIGEGDFDLDELRPLLSDNTQALDLALNVVGALQQREGHLVSSYPLGAAVLATPFFAIAHHVGYLREWHHYRVTAKIAASFMVALSAVFVLLALRASLPATAAPATTAWLLALCYGLGTSAWSISSQELWQHGPGNLCLAAAVCALVYFEKKPSQLLAFGAGLALGLAVYCRLLNAIPTAALTLFIVLHHRRYLASYLAPLVVMAVVIVEYNLRTYGNVSGGYDAIYQSPIHGWRNLTSATGYTHPLLQGLANILISPNRGLLVYSPFLILAFIMMPIVMIKPESPLQRYLVLWIVLMCIVLAKNTLWWGGSTFGPRYFSETCVALLLLLTTAWRFLQAHRLAMMLFAASAGLSIAIHGIGAFFAPCGWEKQPAITDLKPERFWDWRDLEVARCARYGLQHGFKAPEILRYQTGDQDL